MKNKDKINYIIIALSTALCATVFLIPSVYSIFNDNIMVAINLLVSTILLINNFQAIIKNGPGYIIITLLAFLTLVTGAFVSNTGAGSIIVMLNLYLVLLISDSVRTGTRFRKYIELLLLLSYVVFIFVNKNHLNPNTVGYLYLVFYVLSYDLINLIIKKRNKFLYGTLLSGATAVLIYGAGARSVYAAFFVFLLLILTPKKITISKAAQWILVKFMLFGGIIFAYLYVSEASKITENVLVEGKQIFSGRQFIWAEAFTLLSANYLLGVGSKVQLTTFETFNLHSSMLNILVVYGVINFGLVCLMMNGKFNKLFRKARKSSKKPNLLYAVISLFIVGFFETNLVWPSVSFFFALIVIFGFAEENTIKSDKKTP